MFSRTVIKIVYVNQALSDINSRFKANFLLLNLNKTHYLQFRTKNHVDNTIDINYLNKPIANHPYTKFLGLVVDDILTCNNHIDQLISSLNSACYAIRAVNEILSKNVLRMLYFLYVHSIISYGIIFWGNTPNSIKTFRMQKKVLRIINKSKKMDSYRELFKSMEILPLYSPYLFSLLMYVVNNKHLFTKTLEFHNHGTRSAINFHLPTTNLTKYQKGTYYT